MRDLSIWPVVMSLIGCGITLSASFYSLGYEDGKEQFEQLERNTGIEMEYLTLLMENKETATPEERMYLTYLKHIYKEN